MACCFLYLSFSRYSLEGQPPHACLPYYTVKQLQLWLSLILIISILFIIKGNRNLDNFHTHLEKITRSRTGKTNIRTCLYITAFSLQKNIISSTLDRSVRRYANRFSASLVFFLYVQYARLLESQKNDFLGVRLHPGVRTANCITKLIDVPWRFVWKDINTVGIRLHCLIWY